MNVVQTIARKRDGQELSTGEIVQMVDGFAGDRVPDYQMAAFSMAVFFQGMTFRETADLTRAMRDSGVVLKWDFERPCVDKHSTGGIGDKISIPLAPALAACDVFVPMISGRGLGPTGGTLDKLESIDGFRCDLDVDEFRRVVALAGCCISGATGNIAPADKKLYALRDVTATVPSVPLITASILSKKLAEGVQSLVLDVKFGSGAFVKSHAEAQSLARSLVDVSSELGTSATALITDMNQPLGRMVGNRIEIDESIDILRGNGPKDVRELTLELGAQVLADCGRFSSVDQGRDAIASSLDDGRAMEIFEKMVAAQNGNLQRLTPRENAHPLPASRTGHISSIDCEKIGYAVIEMGGGRKRLGDPLRLGAGIEMKCRVGDRVDAEQPLAMVFRDTGIDPVVKKLLLEAMVIDDETTSPGPLIVETVRPT